ncbi:MAG: folate-binding protein YgfZ [Gammaproteobacteria bacterium]|nr:folate-binding protein YgfZ [Gammaproteobacteria bacterium]
MKSEWKEFLQNAGAEFQNDCVDSFGNPERERRIAHTGDLFCDLSHFGIISAYGDDAAEFLQAQFTNDINQVDEAHSQLSALCSPKGRMLCNFRIFRREHTYYLLLPYELLEAALSRLRMFVLRSRVTLEDASDALIGIGASGNKIVEHLCDIVGGLPGNVDESIEYKDFTIVRVAGVVPRFEIYGLLEAMKKLWQALDVHASPVGADVWELLNIRAGIPVITAGTIDAFVPQMANMQMVNGVSFTKGCYPGQEIVARMHYLGKLKRRMYRIGFDAQQAPETGTRLVTETSTESQDIGTILSAQKNPDGNYDALAVIQTRDAENSQLKLGDTNGPDVTVLDLPYSFDDQVKE